MLEQKIAGLLQKKFEEEAFSDCFIVAIKLHEHQKLDVFVDSDSGMTFAKCQQISRYLEAYIDEEGWLGEKYILEVSSPGISRPLMLTRQYKKNIGRSLRLKLTDDTKDEGILVEATDTHIVIEKKVRIKEGKRKRTEVIQSHIPYTQIKEAVVKISFNKK